SMFLSGPQTAQAGAPTEYLVKIQDLNGQPAASRLNVRVLDADQKEIFKQDFDIAAAQQRIVLPPSLPGRPNRPVTLQIARKDDAKSELKQQITLAAPVYVTHLATDKPMYQPGETLHFRSLTLERFSMKPPDETLNLVYTLVQPSGAQVQLGQG